MNSFSNRIKGKKRKKDCNFLSFWLCQWRSDWTFEFYSEWRVEMDLLFRSRHIHICLIMEKLTINSWVSRFSKLINNERCAHRIHQTTATTGNHFPYSPHQSAQPLPTLQQTHSYLPRWHAIDKTGIQRSLTKLPPAWSKRVWLPTRTFPSFRLCHHPTQQVSRPV